MHPKALLDAAAQLIETVLRWQHPADACVSHFFREHRSAGPRDRAVLAETTYAVLRRKILFESLAKTGTGGLHRRLAILGFAGSPSQLDAALSEAERTWLNTCHSALRGADPALEPRHRHNLPAWLAERLQQQLQNEHHFNELANSLLQSAPLDLRVNTLLTKREAAQAALKDAGISATPTPHSPWGLRIEGKPAIQKLDLFQSGHIEVQDEGSQLLALLLDAHRGEMVADFCAGAGGKTLAIGAQMRNTGRLYAFDVSAQRLAALKPRLARSGLSNVWPAAIAHERDERIKRLAAKMDRVLVDAPCSGLGTLRRNPDLKWRQSPTSVAELTTRQTSILAAAATLVKSGGRLVYATCSLLNEENADIAEQFAQSHPEFEKLDAAQLLAKHKIPAAQDLCENGYLKLHTHRHGTDGFFAAVWRKK